MHLTRLKVTKLLVIALLLAAIPPGFAPAVALAVNNGDRIVFMGDPITEAGDANKKGCANLVVRALNRHGLGVTHFGAGVSGRKSHDMLARVDADAHRCNWRQAQS